MIFSFLTDKEKVMIKTQRIKSDSAAAKLYNELPRYFWVNRREAAKRADINVNQASAALDRLQRLDAVEMRNKFGYREWRKTGKKVSIRN